MIRSVALFISLIVATLYSSNAFACNQNHNGLALQVHSSSNLIYLDQRNRFDLTFLNNSDSPIRIFLIEGYAFNHHQISRYLSNDSRSAYFMIDIDSMRGHGYTVDYSDFHLIEPQSKLTIQQSYYVADNSEFDISGVFSFRLKYKNNISQWEGGIETLDGPTKKLFGGSEISYIWLGEISCAIEVKLTR